MFHIVLYQPEIPQNTGNIMRLCVNIDAKLHLIEPLGFILNDRHLKRAGLDYLNKLDVSKHTNFAEFLQQAPGNIFLATTKASLRYSEATYYPQDSIVFGPESKGLPENILKQFTNIKIPMASSGRSLNLANATAIIAYEAWRQNNFM